MDILVLVTSGCLLGVTVVTSAIYYRRLRRAQKEYERARGTVEDIVLSFNRQFRREGEKLEILGYKVEAASSKAGTALAAIEDDSRKVAELAGRTVSVHESCLAAVAKVEELGNRVRDAVASHETLSSRVASLEQQARESPLIPEIGLEAAIPIRREKALAQLTETEVSVLEMLVSEGPLTAPEIKEHIELSREHTARLMKRLYEEGYLEREAGKIPFKYTVKKEMEKFLKKSDNQTA